MSPVLSLLKNDQGSALVEFAIVLPLLVIFTVGIYDFSGAFNQKQKIAQAAQQGAIVAGAQPMGDIQTTTASPNSLQPVVTAVFNSLASSEVLTKANQDPCKLPTAPGWVPAAPVGLTWTYTIANCSAAYPADNLVIAINRGSVTPFGANSITVATVVTVTYPYHYRWQIFGNPNVTESATVHNQI